MLGEFVDECRVFADEFTDGLAAELDEEVCEAGGWMNDECAADGAAAYVAVGRYG